MREYVILCNPHVCDHTVELENSVIGEHGRMPFKTYSNSECCDISMLMAATFIYNITPLTLIQRIQERMQQSGQRLGIYGAAASRTTTSFIKFCSNYDDTKD